MFSLSRGFFCYFPIWADFYYFTQVVCRSSKHNYTCFAEYRHPPAVARAHRRHQTAQQEQQHHHFLRQHRSTTPCSCRLNCQQCIYSKQCHNKEYFRSAKEAQYHTPHHHHHTSKDGCRTSLFPHTFSRRECFLIQGPITSEQQRTKGSQLTSLSLSLATTAFSRRQKRL